MTAPDVAVPPPAVPGPPVLAAGGVLWRPGDDGSPLVALVHRPHRGDWSLPKGKLEPGEHWLQAAVREVREETGWRGRAGRSLGEERYTVLLRDGRPAPKTVRWWVLEALGPDGSTPGPQEVDEVRWLPPDRADGLLSRSADRHRLVAWQAAPRTTTVVLVRHGSAGSRRTWAGEDAERPLDGTGAHQAARLAAVGPAWAPARVLTARPLRCRATVEPLAAAVGVPVEVDDLLAAGADAGRATAGVRDLARAGRPVLVCGQGEALPAVLARLAAEDGLPLPPDPGAPKGSTWVLSFVDDRLVAAEHLPDLDPSPGAGGQGLGRTGESRLGG